MFVFGRGGGARVFAWLQSSKGGQGFYEEPSSRFLAVIYSCLHLLASKRRVWMVVYLKSRRPELAR